MGIVCPDYESSVRFLSVTRPGDPWVLTAIPVDGKGTRTVTFMPEDSDREVACLAWLEEVGTDHNVYYSVNRVGKRLDKKASRRDVVDVAWMHVDLDPEPGKPLEEERARLLAALTTSLPDDLPGPPTILVSSGGGYQAFWLLEDPIATGGDEALADAAGMRNLRLQRALGGDHCHNVDRIMRLPGTINRPDARKRAKNRPEVRAEVIRYCDDPQLLRMYSSSSFPPAEAEKVKGPPDGPGKPSGIRVNSAASLASVLSKHSEGGRMSVDEVIDLAKQGRAPNHPSRSEALFAFCCELVRRGVPDDAICSAVTCAELRISESVLERRGRSGDYARRQVSRARDHAIHPKLAELNDRHAVVGNWGGRCRVIEEVQDPVLGIAKVTRMGFDDFRNRYANQHVQVGADRVGHARTMPVGHWWLAHPGRRTYDSITFAPAGAPPTVYNLWRGFSVEPRPGDCSLFLRHVEEILCKGEAEAHEYLIRWMARIFQCPSEPGQSAVVLRGRQATGKSFVAKHLGHLLGRHYLAVSDPKHLVGAFNEHLRECVLLFADEAFYAGDGKHRSVLKHLITERQIMVEGKGVNAEASANCVHLMMASNEEWVVPADMDERRFLVLDVSDAHARDTGWFDAIDKQLRSGGYEALLHHMLSVDLAQFDVWQVPETDALRQQKEIAMRGGEAWWLEKLMDGRLLPSHDGWRILVPLDFLRADFAAYHQRFGKHSDRAGGVGLRLSRLLERVLPSIWDKRTCIKRGSDAIHMRWYDGREVTIQRPYLYAIPGLGRCRAAWNQLHPRAQQEWPKIEEEGEDGWQKEGTPDDQG